ncbi:MAG: hypothetical protein JW772_01005 [Candidatus Diapherotrites archaeon]|nr:hypothetical protein [Candidatus Diapherotrites archaeon]
MSNTELDALVFCCKYALITNTLGYCGQENAHSELCDFIRAPSEEKMPRIKELLDTFFGLHSYLELIATENSKQAYDFDVVEAYWIGNSLLENIERREIQKTILSLQNFGLPQKLAEEKASSLPVNMLPHHSLHVLHVNFITPKLKPLVDNLSHCMILWAKAESIAKNGKLKARAAELELLNGKFVLDQKFRALENPFNLKPRLGDVVSVHWGNAIQILETSEFKKLRKYTLQNIEGENKLL